MSKMFSDICSALTGTPNAKAAHKKFLANAPDILNGLKAVQRQEQAIPIDDEVSPVFLLSAGWRSGSTLLQRLLMSDSRLLIWGEPYDECGLIQALATTFRAFRNDWPPTEYYYDGTPPNQLSGEWIANLFPSLADLHLAHRALFDRLFDAPARRAGASLWGIKEVRLGIEHCEYLRWLYPRARFIFLYRDPLEAYRSYSRYGRCWYDIFPNKPVFTPHAFGTHWRKLMEGFIREQTRPDTLLVCYEKLIADSRELEKLEAHLGITIDRTVLSAKVGSSERRGENVQISAFESWLLKLAVSPVAQRIGYFQK